MNIEYIKFQIRQTEGLIEECRQARRDAQSTLDTVQDFSVKYE